jgi:hypothetical protein
MESDTGLFLKRMHDPEKVFSARVTMGGEHAMEALARLLEHMCQFLEAHRRVYQVAEDRFSRTRVPSQIGIHGFGKERLPKTRIALDSRDDRIFKFSCERHHSSIALILCLLAFPTSIVGPSFVCGVDGLLLPLLAASTKENHETFPILPKVDSIAWTTVYLPLEDSTSYPFDL